MAMLMIPDRSHSNPHMAPRVKGVAALSVLWTIPGRFSVVPLVIHTRKAKTARKTKVKLTAIRREAITRYSLRPAKKKHRMPITYSVFLEGREKRVPSIWSVKVE